MNDIRRFTQIELHLQIFFSNGFLWLTYIYLREVIYLIDSGMLFMDPTERNEF